MKIARRVLTAAVIMMFAMNASAGEERKGHMPAFSDFDLNGDGTIAEQEFNEGHAKRMGERAAAGHQLKNAGKCTFADVDADSDGAVTPEEFKAHQAGHMNKGKHKHKKCDCKDKENCKCKHHGKHKCDETCDHKHKHKHKHKMKGEQAEQEEQNT